MDFMPLRLNSFSLTCSICALAAIILQLDAMECQKFHIVDSPIRYLPFYQESCTFYHSTFFNEVALLFQAPITEGKSLDRILKPLSFWRVAASSTRCEIISGSRKILLQNDLSFL